VRVLCSLVGLLFVAQSCCVITVFRVACCTSNVSAVGLLTQGVDVQAPSKILHHTTTRLLDMHLLVYMPK
jgi:hypothetical protein